LYLHSNLGGVTLYLPSNLGGVTLYLSSNLGGVTLYLHSNLEGVTLYLSSNLGGVTLYLSSNLVLCLFIGSWKLASSYSLGARWTVPGSYVPTSALRSLSSMSPEFHFLWVLRS